MLLAWKTKNSLIEHHRCAVQHTKRCTRTPDERQAIDGMVPMVRRKRQGRLSRSLPNSELSSSHISRDGEEL